MKMNRLSSNVVLNWRRRPLQLTDEDRAESGMLEAYSLWLDQRKGSVLQKYFQCHANNRAAPFDLDRGRSNGQKRLEDIEQSKTVPNLEFVTTNCRLEPGMKESFPLLPFRALEEMCLPAALQQRWEASVAASKCAEWRLWFQTLDQTQQKAYAESLCKSTKDAFWAGLWLEYEERLEPRQTRFVATAARALVILEQEKVRKQILASKTLIPPPGIILQQQGSYLPEEYHFNLPEGSRRLFQYP